MNLARFSRLMIGLASTTQKKFNKDDILFWHNCFADIPGPIVEAAFKRFVLAGDEWPTIAKIRKLAFETSDGQHAAAGEAFESVVRAVRKFGFYDQAGAFSALDDPTVRAINACGGWEWFCDLNVDNRTTIAAQFRRAYESLIDRTVERRQLPEPLRPRLAEETHRQPAALDVAESMKLPQTAAAERATFQRI